MKNITTAPCPPLRGGLLLLALIVAGVGALLPSPTQAARTRCFAETGHCVSGAILSYWERNGGLPVFGYPITDQQIETVEGTWDASQPSGGDEAAPPGFVAPVRGFGKLWRDNQGIRDALGWAYAPEQTQTGAALSFENGAWMVYITSPQAVFVLHPGGVATYEMYPR